MAYRKVLEYLNSFADYEKNLNYSYKDALKLTRIRAFLSAIGNPQDSLRIIHVAGTKGKGSTCAFTAYILREAGFRVGLYTSPHLRDFRERIRILKPFLPVRKRQAGDFEGMISRPGLSSLVKELKPAIERYNRHSKYGELSFFEVYTAIAFLYFKRMNVDFAVLETGMGGKLDATNAADSLACGLTPISYEHTQKLGKTLAKISREKSGIIKKKGAIVVSARQDKEARQIIHKRCKRFQAKLYEVGRQVNYSGSGINFTVRGLRGVYKNLRINLPGAHQIANAALAVGLVECLSSRGYNAASPAIRRGLYNTFWPARCEVISKDPLVVLDGAQNAASAAALKSAIKDSFSAGGGSAYGGKYRKLILVLGISDDKDIAGICRTLNPLADKVILTRANTPRAARAQKLLSYFKRSPYLTQSVKEAKLLAEKIARKDDLILVTGSLFVVGEYRYA